MFSHLISLNLFIYPRALVVGSGLVPDVHTDSTPEAQTSPLRLVHHVRAPFPSSPNPWITLIRVCKMGTVLGTPFTATKHI